MVPLRRGRGRWIRPKLARALAEAVRENDARVCAQCGEPFRSLIHSPQAIADGLEDAEELCHPFVARKE